MQAVYALRSGNESEARALADAIAFEQTVELSEDRLPSSLDRSVIGRVESVCPEAETRWRAVLSFDVDLAQDSLTQLLNLLAGNVSLHPGIQLADVHFPPQLLDRFPGPRFGVPGLRTLARVESERPLSCAVAKPLGLTVHELAQRCRAFARGGIDLIKDDHSLGDQPWAPFRQRVEQCWAAVEEANRQTGGSTLYLPTLTGGPRDLPRQIEILQALGCKGAVVLPYFQGLETIRWLAETSGFALLGHPTGSGALFHADHGMTPELWFGRFCRMAGCDGVIIPHVEGRFRWPRDRATTTCRFLLEPLGGMHAAMPAPGGSLEPDSLSEWISLYGRDAMFVVGGSLFVDSDIEAAVARFSAALRAL